MEEDELAPAVREILAAARERKTTSPERLNVSARPFTEALSAAQDEGRVPLIAEVKPTSPTTEGTRTDDPVKLAEQMVAGGAAAISVLTEPTHFGGSTEALERVRTAVNVPVLRKDFILDQAQLDAVAADAVLIVVRFVQDLDGLITAVRARGMTPLVEVHTPAELQAALEAGASLIGVNNRDLANLEVDLGVFESLAPNVPEESTLVAESGISTPADVRRMRAAGADALLVGSALMNGDVEANTRRLVDALE